MSRFNINRKLWFLVHSWLALPIWFLLFFICLTGSIATVSHEIVWLMKPEVRANPPSSDALMLSPETIVATIEREHPEADVLELSRPVKSMFAWTVKAAYPDFRIIEHYVNPYTGALQGSAPVGLDFRRFMRALHGWLLVPFHNGSSWGWYAVSFLGLPLLGSLITGLVVYKRFWRGYLRPKIRFDKGARQFWGYVHRLIGIWSAPFILIMSVTAVWFLVQAILNDSGISLAPPESDIPKIIAWDGVPLTADGETPERIGLDRAAELAQVVFPGMEPSLYAMSGSHYDHLRVWGPAAGYPLLTEGIRINSYNGEVEHVQRLSDRTLLALVTASMRPLHTGDFAGLWLKLTYFFFGLLLTLMVLSGMLIWTKRTLRQTVAAWKEGEHRVQDPSVDRGAIRRSTRLSDTGLANTWSRWRFHLSVLLFLVPLAFLPRYLHQNSAERIANVEMGEGQVWDYRIGPWSVRLAEWETQPPELHEGLYEKTFALALCDACVSQVKASYMRVGKPRSNIKTSGALFSGSAYRQLATLTVPEALSANAKLWLTLEGWDGTVHRGVVSLADVSPVTAEWARREKNPL
ncbi:MAG: PepSY-associated TM helix domain-containing protein [Porticoccaceae bacterium]